MNKGETHLGRYNRFGQFSTLLFLILLLISPQLAWGAGWTEQVSGTGNTLRGVHFPVDATTGYVVGSSGVILKTTDGGSNWTTQTSGSSSTLRCVHFPTASVGYVVGSDTTILKTTDGGANWTDIPDPANSDRRYNVYFLTDSVGTVVGGDGTILKTTDGGSNWTEQTSGTGNTLRGVHFPVDATTGYVVGSSGVILKTTDSGSNWNTQTSGTSDRLHSVHFPADATTGYTVGDLGTILKTTDGGSNWNAQTSGTSVDLYTVHFPTESVGYAVGVSGTILKTIDSGVSWTPQISPISTLLNGVHFSLDADTGYVSGDAGKILKTTDGGGSQIVLHPTNNGSVNGFTSETGCGASAHWDCVNDQSGNDSTGAPVANDGTTSYLLDGNGSENQEMFTLANGTIPGGSTISAIMVSAWVGKGSGPSKQVSVSYQRMGTDGSPVQGSVTIVDSSGCCDQLVSSSWTELSWTTTHLDSLEIGIKHVDGGVVNISQNYVMVSYDAPLSLSDFTRNHNNGNVTITWQGATNLVYDVYYADSINGDFTDVADVTASGNTVTWTDDGTQTPSHPDSVTQRYYRVKQWGANTSTNTVGKYTITLQDSVMNMVSIPFVPYNTAISAVIDTQLTGASSELNADRIWKWSLALNKYEIAWLVEGGANDGKWWDTDAGAESNITLGADEGFWIQNRHGSQKVTFLGEVSDTPDRTISLAKGIQMIGSTYPVEVALSSSDLWEDGAAGAINELDADRVWEWDPVTETYKFAWLIDGIGPPNDGKWWDSSTGAETTIKLKPGVGFWFELRDIPGHADFTWTYPKPYSQPPN